MKTWIVIILVVLGLIAITAIIFGTKGYIREPLARVSCNETIIKDNHSLFGEYSLLCDSCKDSDNSDTEGGIDPITIKGIVNGIKYDKNNNPNSYNYTDYCLSNTILMEYNCYEKFPFNISLNCPYGTMCNDGRCV